MTERQQQVLDLIRKHGPISVSELATRLRVSANTAKAHTFALSQQGLAHCSCIGRHSKWTTNTDWRHAIKQAPSVWAYAQRCR